MQPNKPGKFTYQTRVPLPDQETIPDQEAILGAYAAYMSKIERKLFKDMSTGKKANDLKRDYLAKYEITARQFNSCKIQVEGKIASIVQRRPGQILESENRIADLKNTIQKLEKRGANPQTIHQKKRRLTTLTHRHNLQLSDQETGKVRLCFGSKKLFHKQHALAENGYVSHEEWLQEWEDARNDEFFLVGSKDEASGNQSCTATIQDDGRLQLRLRLPPAFEEKYGKYLLLPDVEFKYGHNVILASIRSNQTRNLLEKAKDPYAEEYGVAISYRFKRDKKVWTVFATTSMPEPEWVTRKELGAIGVDINADHIAVAELDRFGNPIQQKVFPLVCYGKTTNQSKALIGDVATEIINLSLETKKPIVVEKLDFQKKKTGLKEANFARQARMLSSFAYSTIISAIQSRGFRYGVRVEAVNPAFTSVIGRVKFAKRYGLSIHTSAAVSIARRYLGFSERLPRHTDKVPDGKGDYVAFTLPVRNENKHVWSHWKQVQRKLKAVLTAHFLAKKRSSNRFPPVCCDRQGLQDLVGAIPTRESSILLLD